MNDIDLVPAHSRQAPSALAPKHTARPSAPMRCAQRWGPERPSAQRPWPSAQCPAAVARRSVPGAQLPVPSAQARRSVPSGRRRRSVPRFGARRPAPGAWRPGAVSGARRFSGPPLERAPRPSALAPGALRTQRPAPVLHF